MANKNIRINAFNPVSGLVNVDQVVVDFTYKKSTDNIDNSLGSSDVGIIELPKAVVRIEKFVSKVRTAEGAATTADIGYTGSAAYFHNDLDINAVAETTSAANPVEIDNTAGDKYITITPSAAVDAAKMLLLVHMVIVDR